MIHLNLTAQHEKEGKRNQKKCFFFLILETHWRRNLERPSKRNQHLVRSKTAEAESDGIVDWLPKHKMVTARVKNGECGSIGHTKRSCKPAQ